MKITTKAILIVGLALLSVTLILYFVLSDISAESFSQLEARQVTRNVNRAVNAISNEITNVDTITLD
jgi:sensor domain CHASE-containing protein